MKALQLLTIGIMTTIAMTTKADDYASLLEASSANPVDATWLITNPSFETGDMQGWIRNPDVSDDREFGVRDDYGMTGKDGRYLFNAYRWWASTLSVSQTVEAIPSGEYEISAVVATWAGRTVTFSANGKTVTKTGINDQTGIPVSMPITIGNEGKLTIEAGSTAAWWMDGHRDESQTFFKLDDVRLLCKGLFLNGVALPLPNDSQTRLKANQWYYFDAPFSTQFLLFGNTSGMVWSTDSTSLLDDIRMQAVEKRMGIQRGRIYFKTPQSDATLEIVMERELMKETLTAAALNVDGLPQWVGFIEVNANGPGSDGTKLISQYLAKKGYDIIGVSEDFNYHGSLISALSDDYGSGVLRATLNVWDISYPFDTDGLNLLWKKSKVSADNESWTQWTETTNDEGNQLIKKGFRHYDLTIGGGIVIDLYVMHMDAGEATSSRQAQWQQLANAINTANSQRPKIILGDTNSRWTREDINAYFTQNINGYTMSDAWVELWRNNIYPNTSMGDITDESDPTNFSNYEVVDKIIYLNPTVADTPQLKAERFHIEQDYTYGEVQGTDNSKALGDHRPVVVDFTCSSTGDIRFILGDVNRSGVIDISDVIVIVNIILGNGSEKPYPYSRFSADVNQDGAIDISDVIAVVNIILNM